MSQYHFTKPGRRGRRVEIRKGGFRISIGALLGAFLLAFLVWLYIDGQTVQNHTEGETASETAVVAVGAFEGDTL